MTRSNFAQDPSQPRQRILLPALAVFCYLVLCVSTLRELLHLNQGHFTYAIDDPYIHLALSEKIALGHYGINLNEASSPSSSVIWPLLLAPFARFNWQVYVPFALNLLAGIAAAALAGAMVARWPLVVSAEDDSYLSEAVRRVATVIALVFAGNLLGLTFVGMEHTLQVLLAGVGAWAIVKCLQGEPIPVWCLIAVAIAPLVRYEGLGIVAGVAVALVGWRQTGRAITLVLASVAPLIAFSFYLHRLGLPWLPTSVLVKGNVAQTGAASMHQGVHMFKDSIRQIVTDPQRGLVALLCVALIGLAWIESDRVRRFAFSGAAAATALHVLVGRYHWFHRYEAYIVFFAMLVVLHATHERPRGFLGWYAIGLLGCCFLFISTLNEVPRSASELYRQHFQMHRFVTEFYKGDFAVNDLGYPSYRRPRGSYVLDLWGLASPEAAHERNKDAAWMDKETRAHHVGLVMYYPTWFPGPAPADWTQIGELCLKQPPVAITGQCVTFMATPEASVSELRDDFRRFSATLPDGATAVQAAVAAPAGPPQALPRPGSRPPSSARRLWTAAVRKRASAPLSSW